MQLTQAPVHGGGHHPTPGHGHGCAVKATAAGLSMQLVYAPLALMPSPPLLLYTLPVAALRRLWPGDPSPPLPRLSPLTVTSSLRI